MQTFLYILRNLNRFNFQVILLCHQKKIDRKLILKAEQKI